MFCHAKSIINKFMLSLTAAVCAGGLWLYRVVPVCAAEARLEKNLSMPVQSNQIESWPVGPAVGAEAAILIEAETGTVLYSKNIHWKEYPASTTKILTTLIATERCGMDEIVNFSYDAVFDNPPGSSGIAMDVGQALTMEQCLQAILIRSANEVAFAVAEHISGTANWSVFADMMNQRAEELGAINTHFANPNGLPDENHYTTAYDLAMMGRAFFDNEMLCKITLTRRLEIPASDRLPHQKLELNSMKIIPTGKYAYEYLVGCKTGYTEAARSCLVSCAEKDGMRLICAVLKDEEPYQYTDTIALFEYGFSNFSKVNISQSETEYDIDGMGLLYSGKDIFGSSRPFLSLDQDACIVLPASATLDSLESHVEYDAENKDQAAVKYTFHGVDVGSVPIIFAGDKEETYFFGMPLAPADDDDDTQSHVIYIDVTSILAILALAAAAVFVGMLLHSVLKNYNLSGIRRKNGRPVKKRRPESKFKDYDF